jgi:hypothetical protein
MNNCCVCFSCIILLGILFFKGLTARRIYKSFGFKGLNTTEWLLSKKIMGVNQAMIWKGYVRRHIADIGKDANGTQKFWAQK